MTEKQKNEKILFMIFCLQCAKHVLESYDESFDDVSFGIGSMRVKDVRGRVNIWLERYSKLARERKLKYPSP